MGSDKSYIGHLDFKLYQCYKSIVITLYVKNKPLVSYCINTIK